MIRRLRLLLAAATMVNAFALVTPGAYASIQVTCDDSPPYAVFYTEGSGTGNRLVFCYGDSYSSLSSTFNNTISSVVVVGPNSTGKVPCGYDYTSWAGNYVKLSTGQHGFAWTGWPYTVWTSNGAHMDDQISSLAWCPV